MVCAPIVLFVYNRPWHAMKTVEALKKNALSEISDLIVFSDAPKNHQAVIEVQWVRDYLRKITGFKSVRIIERQENFGLAKSIIVGVTDVVKQYGKIIVLEDDIVTSPAFLGFMNRALDIYTDKSDVWHVSGWSYPIATDGLNDVFFWRGMNCWGWATWADRWAHFEKNPARLVDEWSRKKKKHFDLGGSRVFWPQVELNMKGDLNTWAIFWYSTIYENKGLCLNPSITYVENIGHDGSGTHCGVEQSQSSRILNTCSGIVFPKKIEESELAVRRIIEFYRSQKKPFLVRVANYLSRLVFGKNLIK